MTRGEISILFISARDPYTYGGMLYDSMKSLEMAGHNVDFLTLYSFPKIRKNMTYLYKESVLSHIKSLLRSSKLFKYLRKTIFRNWTHNSNRSKPYITNNGVTIVNYYESKPPVDPKEIICAIRKRYDLIVTSIWQDMISAETLRQIYQKFHTPIIITPADMFPMTGGCYYFGKCTNWKRGCGNCPGLNSNSKNDQTSINYQYKKYVYAQINCALLSNSYMINIAKDCHLFDNSIVKFKTIVIDENKFYPLETTIARKHIKIPSNKKFILFARSVPLSDPRKGMLLMADAINCFCKNKSKQELQNMLLLLVGSYNHIENHVPIDVKYLGVVDTQTLIEAYSATTVFLSPTIDDAGPSMVNQSIMCGTPVVAFHIGTAIDVIKQYENGYCAKYADIQDFAEGISYIYKLSYTEYNKMRYSTRQIALSFHSMQVNANIIMETYNELIELQSKFF